MKPPSPLPPLAVLVARLVLAGTFVAAAVQKIREPAGFADDILAYRVAGPELARWVALVLPWLELTTGFGLLIRRIRRASAIILSVLLAAFIALHLAARARGLDIDCGCFGDGGGEGETSYLWLLARNLFLLAVALWLVRDSWRNPSRRLPSKPS